MSDSGRYMMMSWYEKIYYTLKRFFKGLFCGIADFFKGIPNAVVSFFKAVGRGLLFLVKSFTNGDVLTKLSFVLMGSSNLFRGQIVKGFLYLIFEIAYVIYMVLTGASAIAGLKTLGTKKQGWVFDEKQGIDIMQQGDNSMLMLLFGVFAVFVTAAFVIVYISNIKSAVKAEEIKKSGKKLPGFVEDVKNYFDGNFHKTILSLPILGVLTFTVLPLVFMILIAFTNYDSKHQPPGNLFTWIGLDNFKVMLSSGGALSRTFWPVLGWTLIWAVFATFLNYIFGMLLAMLINKKEIKFKGLFRTIFVLSIAIPQFVSLLIMRNMLNDQGAVNVLLKNLGLIDSYIPFLSDANTARITIIIINLWIGIPYSMLITTGILQNIPGYLYESATIDGASSFTMFFKITLPYVIFVTTPYLITQFIGNLNNFNVIYLLSGGGPSSLDYYQAGKTDLLVTWLYKLTVNSKDYSYASTIGILVFVISAVLSLLTYRNTGSYKNEEDFQ